MKINHIVLTVLLTMVTLHICIAEDIVLTKSQKIALEVARAFDEILSIQDIDHYKFIGYSLNSANEVIADFIHIGSWNDDNDFSGLMHKSYTLKGSSNEVVKTVIAETNCRKDIMNISFYKGKVKISTKRNSYVLTLENDKVVFAEEPEYKNFPSSFEKYRYKFLYNENGKIASIEAYTVIGKGKNYSEATESYSYFFRVKKFDYQETDNKIIVSLNYYNKPKNPKSEQPVKSTSAIIINDRQSNFLVELFPKGISGEKYGTKEFSFNENYWLTKTVYNSFKPVESEIREYIFNEQGVRDTVIIQLFDENGKYKERTEYYLKYSLKNGSNAADICSYEYTHLARTFDSNNEVVKESTLNKIRVKKDGVWSDWKFLQY